MLQNIAYFQIFGKPLILYIGALTLISFIITAMIPFLNKKGIKAIPFAWHTRLAGFSIALAIIHALLAVLAYF